MSTEEFPDVPVDVDTMEVDKSEVKKSYTKKPLTPLELVELGDDLILVKGTLSIKYKKQMYSLIDQGRRGKYNRDFGGWVYSSDNREEVENFIRGANEGDIAPDFYKEKTDRNNKSGKTDNIGVVAMPKYGNPRKQMLTYHIFRPSVGMTVTIKVDGNINTYQVINTNNKRGMVDEVIILWPDNETKSKLLVCSGRWQVVGMINRHSIRFK
uniref:Uncharacterized protein n=1 Tax=Pithovirus LCPAC101 TaxID=2506586 RepID=A0A481Z4H4_9VIRU|nr:MAG: uncharacterized protein LCPAC101_01820 [Pithovirus LCPAC101]